MSDAKDDVTPRLLDEVPNLAQPLPRLQDAVFAWASKQGFGAVYGRDQFESLHSQVMREHTNAKEVRRLRKLDFEIARGALRAQELRPEGGWDSYVEQWTVVRLEHRMRATYGKTEFTRLRSMEERIGGILLDSRAMPLMLIVPQPTGTYIQMGWETIIEVDRSPFAPTREKTVVLREHIHPDLGQVVMAPA